MQITEQDRPLAAERSCSRWGAAAMWLATVGLAAGGFALLDLVEPEWPENHDRTWGGWSRTRGLLTPGTAIYVAKSMT